MTKEEFFFELPEELIAQTPILDRSASRMLVLDKKTGLIEHTVFSDMVNYCNPGDCLVINDTKVIPARLIGRRKTARVEFLLLNRKERDVWEVIVYPGKKARVGDIVVFGDGLLTAEVLEITDLGNRVVRFSFDGLFEELLDRLGEMPLPPYITEKLEDKERYQTVYAKHEGSSAAPTAGLHFTNEIFEQLAAKKVHLARVTLHIGLGTFRPVKVSNIAEHMMHSEVYCIEREQAEIVNRAKKNGGKIIAVGTTSCRTLESCADENGFLNDGAGATDIFMYPGYQFKIVDGLITNFHLPESTLIMLVSALCGKDVTLQAYQEAVRLRYRFFSFGDAMFIKD